MKLSEFNFIKNCRTIFQCSDFFTSIKWDIRTLLKTTEVDSGKELIHSVLLGGSQNLLEGQRDRLRNTVSRNFILTQTLEFELPVLSGDARRCKESCCPWEPNEAAVLLALARMDGFSEDPAALSHYF